MPNPQKRSRTLRRVYVRTPSGRNVIHYYKRKPKIPHCSNCGKPLKGVLRERQVIMKRIPRTKKRPERPYSHLCSKCMRREIIRGTRKNV